MVVQVESSDRHANIMTERLPEDVFRVNCRLRLGILLVLVRGDDEGDT